jgi:uncharacterized protein YbjT (DUF2867 family)
MRHVPHRSGHGRCCRQVPGRHSAGAAQRERVIVILITGANGFIGAALVRRLVDRGHAVIRGVRTAPAQAEATPGVRVLAMDFATDHDVTVWRTRLAGVTAVVNLAGIFRETASARFDDVHVRGPIALFRACAEAGVSRVVQGSALGADAGATSGFHRSKKAADDALLALPLSAVVMQPSLVFGPEGASTRLFLALASVPVLVLPGGGRQPVQPIHRDDLVDCCVRLVETDACAGERVPLVGPHPLALRDYLRTLATGLGVARPAIVSLPMPAARGLARHAGRFAGDLVDPEALDMLARGNTGDAAATTMLLGRPPRPPAQFIPPGVEADRLRADAIATWMLPLFRASLAFVWLATAAVSSGLYPLADSLALVGRLGLTGVLAQIALWSGVLADLAFGIATLVVRGRPALWLLQAATIVAYSLLIAVGLPEFWLHPFGPLTKNVPILALLAVLYAFESRQRRC